MSLKARITLLTMAVTVTMLLGLTFVQLHNVVESWLAGAYGIAELAGQQVKYLLISRLQERQAAEARAGRHPGLDELLASDVNLPALLETTMAQARSAVEIAVTDRNGNVAASSNPLRTPATMPTYPALRELRELSPLRRINRLFRGNTNYDVSVPLGIAGDPTPLFTIHVLVSPVLLRHEAVPAMLRVARWGAAALIAALVLVWLSTRLLTRNLAHLSTAIDRISSGETTTQTPRRAAPEFAVIESKLDMLGQKFRGAEKLRQAVQAVLDGLEEAILVFDADGRLTLAGGPVARVLGFAFPEARGRSIEELFPPETRLGLALRDAVANRRGLREGSFPWASGGGSTRVLVNLEFGSAGPGRVTTLLRIRDDAGARHLESQLGTSVHADGISRIVGAVAHEIKNPLNSIAVRLDNLQAWASDEFPAAEDEIQVMVEEVNRLDRVVRTFLELTRPVELSTEDLDMTMLCRDVAALMQPEAARRGIDLAVLAPRQPVLVTGDHDMLKEAVINLVGNGMEAMTEGGALRINVGIDGRNCVICVSDTGSGIEDDVRARMFEPYFTTRESGTGLGLPRTLRAVQLHGGVIDLDTALGKGTDIYVRLPLKA